MLPSKVLRMGIQKILYQKTYELQVGLQEFDVDFKGYERQVDWLEISLVYDKSHKYRTIYYSYNAKSEARMMKNIDLSNISDAYSATNTMKFDINNDTQKDLLWKQYIAWHCDGYTKAPVSDYINNPVFQELLSENTYISNTSDERIYIHLRDSLGHTNDMERPRRNDSRLKLLIETKIPLTNKMELRVWGYTNGEYLYMLYDGCLMLKYQTYTIKSLDNALKA